MTGQEQPRKWRNRTTSMLADWQRRSPRRSQRVAAREEKTACRRYSRSVPWRGQDTRPEKKACTEATRVEGRSLSQAPLWEKRQFPARRAPLSLSADSHARCCWLTSGHGTRVRVSAGEPWAWSGKAWCRPRPLSDQLCSLGQAPQPL